MTLKITTAFFLLTTTIGTSDGHAWQNSMQEQTSRYFYAVGHNIMLSLEENEFQNKLRARQAREELGYIMPHLITKFDTAYLKVAAEKRVKDGPRKLSRRHVELAEIRGLTEYVNTLRGVGTVQGLPSLNALQQKLLAYLEGAVLSGFGVYMIRVGTTLQYYSCDACQGLRAKTPGKSCSCKFTVGDLPPQRVDDIAKVVTSGFIAYYDTLRNEEGKENGVGEGKGVNTSR